MNIDKISMSKYEHEFFIYKNKKYYYILNNFQQMKMKINFSLVILSIFIVNLKIYIL